MVDMKNELKIKKKEKHTPKNKCVMEDLGEYLTSSYPTHSVFVPIASIQAHWSLFFLCS